MPIFYTDKIVIGWSALVGRDPSTCCEYNLRQRIIISVLMLIFLYNWYSGVKENKDNMRDEVLLLALAPHI